MLELALTPLHVTTTVPEPGLVEGPMSHVQEALPAESAVFMPRPCAVDFVPDGVVYPIEQVAPGCVAAVTLARPPGAAPFAETICTAPLWVVCVWFGVAVLGAVVGFVEADDPLA
jgi:hypothetical protein